MEVLSFFTGLWFMFTGFLGLSDGVPTEEPAEVRQAPPIEERAPEELTPREELPELAMEIGNGEGEHEDHGHMHDHGTGPHSHYQDGPSETGGRPGGPGGPPPSSGSGGPDGSTTNTAGGNGPTGSVPSGPGGGTNAPINSFVGGDTQTINSLSIPNSDFFGSYEIDDNTYGTEVTVTVSGSTRTIVANALPNHETGDFPNSGNPHSIEAQNISRSYPAEGTYTGNAIWSREPGIAVNGVKFEPETAEVMTCTSGESYKIEAFQDDYDLGFDINNAHVQPTGEYHYHGFPTELVELYADGQDLVHIGFSEDGFMIYYDTTGTVESSWRLSSTDRTGTDCSYRNDTMDLEGASPDGTFVSDWEYVSGSGNLDACNGAYVDGEYAYFVTQEYPYVSRCLQGS